MELTKELAEALGTIVADGCVQKKYVCMWGNVVEDKEYYDAYLGPLFSKLFNKELNIHEKKSNSVYGFYLCGKAIVKVFSEFGLKPEPKTYTVSIPEQIMQSGDDEIICAFLRGFADCDGCLNFDKSHGNYVEFKRIHNHYPRIILTTVSMVLAKQMMELVQSLGFTPCLRIKRTKQPGCTTSYCVVLRGILNLEHWMKFIGFSNPSKSSKYFVWKKYGFCQANTTIVERQKLLKGEINPYSLAIKAL